MNALAKVLIKMSSAIVMVSLGGTFAADLAIQLRKDQNGTAWEGKDIICYAVPPMSPIRRLPDRVPLDEKVTDQLLIVAAPGEFEPASFVIFGHTDVDNLVLRTVMEQGCQVPSSAIDIKVVKCWFQAGTAWHSYFADPTRRELVPELLLNDETLVKVDHETQDNYLRVDYPEGSEYVWISYTSQSDPGTFNYVKEPVADSQTLKPVQLKAGEGKQFWVTVKVPEYTPAGMHELQLLISTEGTDIGALKLRIHVLPFSLPEPRTYYDINAPFFASIYNRCGISEDMKGHGASMEEASAKLQAEYKNMRDHGCDYPLIASWNALYQGDTRHQFLQQLKILKESGLKTRPIFGGVHIIDHGVMIAQKEAAFPAYEERVNEAFSAVMEVLGHTDVYPVAWDEPRLEWLITQRRGWKYVHQKGGRIMSTSKDSHFGVAAHNEDFSNYGGEVGVESARKWHAVGGKVSSYASPHTGPENPDYIRRTHGMIPYKSELDGTCNYMYYEGDPNIWNEFNKHTFRCFNMVYPTRGGVVDTIAWEGFREAIDDIRYATKLRQLAFRGIDSGDFEKRYAGKIALQWLHEVNERIDDLNTVRLEMIHRIMKLHALLDGERR